MKPEEAIEILEEHWRYSRTYKYTEAEIREALDMAIKALEQETILDKIRTEIDGLTYYWCEVNPRSVIDDVLDIIDKYKAESEDEE